MPKKLKQNQKKPRKSHCNKNFTYHEYNITKKARNHKARESWASVLNKLGEHSINLGLSLETAYRDFEGTGIIFSSNGHDGPASGDFSLEGNIATAKRFEETLKLSLINNRKKQLYENIQTAQRIRFDNPNISDFDFEQEYKQYENDYEKKKYNRTQLLMIVHPMPNNYHEKTCKDGSRK